MSKENQDPTSRQVVEHALELADQAGTPLKEGPQHGDPVQNGGNVAEQMSSLPLRELIAGPLIAASEAQERLAATALQFYERIAFEEENKQEPSHNGDTPPESSTSKKTRILSFDIRRPVEENGRMVMKDQRIEAPFIGLVPIPSLLIDRIDVDFQMEVTASTASKETSQKEASSSITAKYFGVGASIQGKVSSSRENTRSTNQTAKYQIHVSASQQPQTEGLSKLMDIMASCIEPLPAADAGGEGGGGQE